MLDSSQGLFFLTRTEGGGFKAEPVSPSQRSAAPGDSQPSISLLVEPLHPVWHAAFALAQEFLRREDLTTRDLVAGLAALQAISREPETPWRPA